MNPLEYWGDLRVAIEQELTVEKKLIWWLDRFEEIDHIIVPSRFAAWELSQYGGVRQSSISVIYHGVDPNRFYPPTAVFQRSGVLHVSSWQPKKNVSALISAFNACDALQKEGLELVLGGKDAKILAGNSKWIHIDPEIADDSRLRQKYHKSKVFVFPSFHETFGLPVLEAMACGCPVVCSDRAALKEVYADASLQVDPRDTKALAEAINAVIGDARLSTDLVERGLSLAATLTWKTSAEQHIRCFDGLR
jgi:glycosyltransferase involved in cell wall biosynthesis